MIYQAMTADKTNDIKETIESPLQGAVNEMKQALKITKNTKKKNKNQISIDEEKRENRIIERKKQALEKESQ